MMDISLARRRRIRCRTLRLPMEQRLIDRIIIVHSGRRIILVRLVQRDKEHIRILGRQPLHTLTERHDLFICAGEGRRGPTAAHDAAEQ